MNSQKGESVAAGTVSKPLTEEGVVLSHLFAEHHRRILAAAYRITGSVADAEDVAQAVFLRLAQGGDIEIKNPGSFLYRAAINGALDLLRRRKTSPSEPLELAAHVAAEGWGSSPDAMLSSSELGGRLRVAISELAPRAAEMFTLRYLEDLGNREIASLLGTSQAVVAVTLHQARSRLKKRLKQLELEKR